jgi:basic membrane protein A and related proteins
LRPFHGASLLALASLVAVTLLLLPGCSRGGGAVEPGPGESGPGTPAAEGRQVSKMAIITPEEADDFGWNQQGVESAQAVADSIGAELEVADGAGYDDVSPVMRQLAEDGADLIIAWASGYNTVAPRLAEELDVPVVVIGAFEEGLLPGLSVDLETEAQDGAYLAGVLAAEMTRSGTAGIVMSADDENWVKMAGGFAAGARAARPDIKLLLAQIGQAGYADAAGGKRVTETVIAGGADVVFGMGDGSSFGMIQACETASGPTDDQKVWFIDVIGDKTSLDEQGIYLSSVVWDYSGLLEEAVRQLEEGSFGSEVLYLGLEEGGLGLLRTDHIPVAAWAKVEQAREQVAGGEVEVPVARSRAEVEDLVRQ